MSACEWCTWPEGHDEGCPRNDIHRMAIWQDGVSAGKAGKTVYGSEWGDRHRTYLLGYIVGAMT